MKKILKFILIFLIAAFAFVFVVNYSGTNLDQLPNSNVSDNIESIEEEILEPEVKTTTATLLATGDIMFHKPQIDSAYISEDQTYDFLSVFEYVKKDISDADIAIANFETVTAGDDLGFTGYPTFNSPTATLAALKKAGFDILNTVNNHSVDRGREGIINTIDHINNNGMKNIGTYKDRNNSILIEEVNEIDMAFMSYSYGFNGLDVLLNEEEQSYMINTIDEDKIKEDIESAKAKDVDLIIVFIHWGNEYEREPSQYQIELGNKMVEWGANIILGTHPHVIQKSEIIEHNGKDNFIIYSMGNFLSNQRKDTMGNSFSEDGVMVEIELEKNLLEGETIIKDVNYKPTWVRKYKEANNFKYSILPIEEFLNYEELNVILNDNEKARINKSFEDTMEVMFKYY